MDKPAYNELIKQIEELKKENAVKQRKIEELTKAYEIAEEDSEILNLFLEYSPIYFFLKDENVRAIRLSRNFEKLLGLPLEVLLNTQMHEVFKTQTAKDRDDLELKLLKDNTSVRYEDDVIGRVADTYKFPIQLKGKPPYLAGYVVDITDRVLAERALKESEKQLSELNRDKDRFITILAHDLRNPFNSILGYLELLTKNIRNYDIDKTEKYINIVNNSAKKTFNLLEDVLMWARSHSGKLPFEPQKLVLKEAYGEVIESIEHQANEKRIAIDYFEPEKTTLFADLKMLKTILRNLISNAIKFTHTNGQITIFAQNNENQTTISVSDNGVGIEENIKNNLWEVLRQYTSTGTAHESGTGLGLVLCKEFVEKHNGKIWVESEVGKGTTFTFVLPNTNNQNIDIKQPKSKSNLQKENEMSNEEQQKSPIDPSSEMLILKQKLSELFYYETSKILHILNNDKTQNEELIMWKKDVENAAYDSNEKKFLSLTKI